MLDEAWTNPSDQLVDHIEDLIVQLSDSHFSDHWTRRDWPLMRDAVALAKRIQSLIDDGKWRAGNPPLSYWQLLHEVCEACLAIESPPDLPEPRTVQLETLEQLAELKPPIRDEQVCQIFGFVDEAGRPDFDRLARARAGKEEVPKTRTLPVDSSWPERRPHMGFLEALADAIQAERV
jgi:hypothetical protein